MKPQDIPIGAFVKARDLPCFGFVLQHGSIPFGKKQLPGVKIQAGPAKTDFILYEDLQLIQLPEGAPMSTKGKHQANQYAEVWEYLPKGEVFQLDEKVDPLIGPGFFSLPYPVTVKKAAMDYDCRACGQAIAEGEKHASTGRDHFHLLCTSNTPPAPQFKESLFER